MFTDLLLSLCLFASIKDVRSNQNMANNRTKILIEDAGCPFQSNDQFLQRKQCLMPNYLSSDPPKVVQFDHVLHMQLEAVRSLQSHLVNQ